MELMTRALPHCIGRRPVGVASGVRVLSSFHPRRVSPLLSISIVVNTSSMAGGRRGRARGSRAMVTPRSSAAPMCVCVCLCMCVCLVCGGIIIMSQHSACMC